MKTIGFLGGYDKIDLLIYIAKILTLANKRVILIDTTASQKAKYVVPSIDPSKTYITEFQGFDVAVGFNSIEDIAEYSGRNIGNLYDIALLDIDSSDMFKNFYAENNYKNYFVSAFDLYSIKKGMEILNACEQPIKITKVLFSANMKKEESEYLDYLSRECKVEWNDIVIDFPIELGIYSVSIGNQMTSRIRFKKLSNYYKKSLQYLMEVIFEEDISPREISRIMKTLEKEG